MRFVAGRGPSGKLCGWGALTELLLAEAPQANRGGGMERSGSLCGRVAAPRETLHGRQCCTIGKQLRVDAETPDAGRPVEKRLCRNDDSETPMQQRHLGTLLHKSNAQRWVWCVPRCARNQVSEQANLRASNRASYRAGNRASYRACNRQAN